MISERELWAAANMVIQQHEDDAPLYIAERIGTLALQGDKDGIAVWKAIAHRVDQLNKAQPDTKIAGLH